VVGFSVEKALINATPSCHSGDGMGNGVVGAIGGMQQATGIGVFRAPLSARHSFSVFPRRNPADSQLAFLHKFPPNATLHCGISISGCPGCRFWP